MERQALRRPLAQQRAHHHHHHVPSLSDHVPLHLELPGRASAPARIPGQRAGGQPEAASVGRLGLRRVHGNPRLVALPPEHSQRLHKQVRQRGAVQLARAVVARHESSRRRCAHGELGPRRRLAPGLDVGHLLRALPALAFDKDARDELLPGDVAPRRRRPGVLHRLLAAADAPARVALEHARRAVVRR